MAEYSRLATSNQNSRICCHQLPTKHCQHVTVATLKLFLPTINKAFWIFFSLTPQSQDREVRNWRVSLQISLAAIFGQPLPLLHFTWGTAEVKYIFATAICVSVSLSLAIFPHYCTDRDVTWKNGRECPLVVHYRADLQSARGFHCYDNRHICKLTALYTANA